MFQQLASFDNECCGKILRRVVLIPVALRSEAAQAVPKVGQSKTAFVVLSLFGHHRSPVRTEILLRGDSGR